MLAPAFGLGEVEIAYRIVELVLCLFVQVALVAFQGEDVVGLFLDNGLGNGGLRAHGIDANDLTFQIQHFKEQGNGGDFVAFITHKFLGKGNSAIR